MTRDRYLTLSAAVLKDLAKARRIKGAYAMKKEELIDAMLLRDAEEERAAKQERLAAERAAGKNAGSDAADEKKAVSDPDTAKTADPEKDGAGKAKREKVPAAGQTKERAGKQRRRPSPERGEGKTEEDGAEKAAPRRRGRPRKNPVPAVSTEAGAPAVSAAEASKEAETRTENRPAQQETVPAKGEPADPGAARKRPGRPKGTKNRSRGKEMTERGEAKNVPDTQDADRAPKKGTEDAEEVRKEAREAEETALVPEKSGTDVIRTEALQAEDAQAEAAQAEDSKPDQTQAEARKEDRSQTEKQKEERTRESRGREDRQKEERAKRENEKARGILEVMPDGFGFLRSENFLPGEEDIYVSPSQIRRFNLKTGDMVSGLTRQKGQGEKFGALLYVERVNDRPADEARNRLVFEHMTPVFPYERIRLERPGGTTAARIVDLICPIGKGQRGMIVSPPKAGKTTLLKDIAKSILYKDPDANVIILLIDERPEEVTDMKESVHGKNVEIIYSTFDELPEHHKRVSEMVIERAKRLVEQKQDVIILLDSITRLARAYNVLVPQSGRTLSGGLDPTALYMPKRFFGAARKMREGGSLTILATALVDTGSKMDDVVYEEFKGTGNMELILDRKLQERRIFPAIDITKSGTRREDLLLTEEELEAVSIIRRSLGGIRAEEATDAIINTFARLKSNSLVVQAILQKKQS